LPDSYGKRNRDRVKASKAAARDERRVARNIRQKLIDSGQLDPSAQNEGETPPEDGVEQPEAAPAPEARAE
jgi:hypothetical protein